MVLQQHQVTQTTKVEAGANLVSTLPEHRALHAKSPSPLPLSMATCVRHQLVKAVWRGVVLHDSRACLLNESGALCATLG